MDSSAPIKAMKIQNIQHPHPISIKYLSPTVLLFFSVLFFLLVLPVLPIDVQYPISEEAMLFWLICFLCFLGGTLLGAGGHFRFRVNNTNADPRTLKIFLLIVVLIGFTGTILLVIDRYMIRGVSLVATMLENRAVLGDSRASAISVIAAMASSIGMFSYILIWMVELSVVTISRWVKILAIINLLTSVTVSVLMGSRSLLLVLLFIHIFAWYFVIRTQGKKMQFKYKVVLLFLLLLLASISSIIMVWRVELMGLYMSDSLTISGYAYTIQPSSFVQSYFRDEETQWMGILAGLFSLVQYVFHGIYEFGLLFDNFQGEFEMGGRTFWLPVKVLSMITGGPVGGVEHIGERTGIFTTFVGPVFIDFGWLSPVVLIIYGALIGLPFRLLKEGRLEWLPAVALVATSMILWPVVNIFISASGTYLLVAAVAIGLMGKRLRVA